MSDRRTEAELAPADGVLAARKPPVAAMLPTVSVVIPCYNYGRFLTSCVASVVGQHGVRTRVLIIDDASTDDSAETARRLAVEHDEVEVVVHEVNQGHIRTYNEGLLGWADGEYVTLLSADDELPPGSLARSVAIMEAHPSVGMVYGGIEEFGDLARPATPHARRAAEIVYPGGAWLRRRCRTAVNVVPTPGTVLRTEIQRRAGGYDPILTHAGDFDMWLRVALLADVGYVQWQPQGRYRMHGNSMSFGVYQERLADVRQRKLVFESLVSGHGRELEAVGIRSDDAFARLASQSLWWACRAYEKGDHDPAEIDRLLEFAAEAYPAYPTLRAFRALRRRQRLGPRICHRTQLFIGTAIVRRLLSDAGLARWRRRGD